MTDESFLEAHLSWCSECLAGIAGSITSMALLSISMLYRTDIGDGGSAIHHEDRGHILGLKLIKPFSRFMPFRG